MPEINDEVTSKASEVAVGVGEVLGTIYVSAPVTECLK